MTSLASRARFVAEQSNVHEEVEVVLSTEAKFVADGRTGKQKPGELPR